MTKRARAPATVANVACGFDVFGLALEHPYDEVVAESSQAPGAKMLEITGDDGKLPLASDKNTACVAVNAMLKSLGSNAGVSLRLKKGLPLASGLGSSAASAVAALVATNALLGNPLTKRDLLPFAMEGEKVACGTAHADNVAPSLLGGFVIVRSYTPLDVVSVPTPKGLYCAVTHPHVEVRTEDARRVIGSQIPLNLAIANWGNAAALVAGLYANDFALIGRALDDRIFEPARSSLIPGFYDAKEAALKAGALGCSISGSGPSVFALCDSREIATNVAEAMKSAFSRHGLGSDAFVSEINGKGAEVIGA